MSIRPLFVVQGLLSADECRTLIERGEALGFERAAVRTHSGLQMRPDIRDNDRAAFVDEPLAAELWRRISAHVPRELEGGTAVGLDEHFRFYRYDVGQRFKRHIDGTVERLPGVRSRLSCLFYLNEGFSGGETVFYSDEKVQGLRQEERVVVPQAGDGLLFLHEWRHEGRELIAGRKYVLRTDVFYSFTHEAP
jgi:predicted 2-oxoglutarate/Fe(II)-dependent dioxygenase YbiX